MKCVVLCGLPNSGKSTLVKNEYKNYEIVSRDDTLEQYGRKKYGESEYSKIWNKLTKEDQCKINELLEQKINNIVAEGKDAVIDMTMLTKKVRKEMMDKFKGYDFEIVALVVPFDKILERNEKRFEETGKYIPLNVLQDMFLRYELPGKDESSNLKEVTVMITI